MLPEAGQTRPDVLYIHIPFCESLCPFCSFHRVLLDRDRAKTYFPMLRKEIRQVAARGYQPSVVYVGGGTPTVLPEELCETLALVRSLFPVRQVSIETNPNHLREDIFVALKQAGVNRVSVGVQSFDNRLLRAIDRRLILFLSITWMARLTVSSSLMVIGSRVISPSTLVPRVSRCAPAHAKTSSGVFLKS